MTSFGARFGTPSRFVPNPMAKSGVITNFDNHVLGMVAFTGFHSTIVMNYVSWYSTLTLKIQYEARLHSINTLPATINTNTEGERTRLT